MITTERIRRFILPIIVVCLLTTVVYAEECEHVFEQRRLEPTCEEQGVSWQECVLCGLTYGYEPILPAGHKFGEWYVLTEPTCTKPGVQVRECLVCEAQEEEALPNPGHVYEPEVRHPTCTASGYTRYNCRSCSSYYIADYTEPLGHWYDNGVVIQEPTDTARGRVRFTCIRCSESHQTFYTFRDINSGAYYFVPVLWAVDNGITSGIDETHFCPDQICNRAQVVTFLWRAAGKPEPSTTANPFMDVPKGCFYEKAVLWAYETGITTGTAARRFSPDAPCNRAQVVTFLHRAKGCPEPTITTVFPDVAENSFYHKAVLWAAERGITVGMDGGNFCPATECTRGQIVTFLYRDEKNP